MKRLQTAILALMMAGAVTFTAWPATSVSSQSTNETAQNRNKTPDIVNELPVFVNETAASVIRASTETAATPEPEYFWEGDDPNFTGYPAHYEYTDREIDMLAQTVYGEARGCSAEEQRLVIWTALQRVDDGYWGDTIEAVLTAPHQFAGYHTQNPIDKDIRALCLQEVADWSHGAEPPTFAPYAATTPYLYFDGDGRHNWFREGWR